MSRLLRLFLALLVAAASFSVTPALASPPDCQFVLGFLTLESMIPDTVGACLTDVQYNPANGDGLQNTTGQNGAGGLMVWRKADNFTAFTDGSHTWINGPFGLQERFNSQRFFWEWNPDGLPIVPPPVAGEQCHTAQLSLAPGQSNGAAGHIGAPFIFTNNATVSCTFEGYVGAQMLDARNNALPTNVVRGGGYIFRDPGPSLVNVPPGRTATFGLEWSDVPVGNETACSQSSQLEVTPPDEFAPIIIPYGLAACNGGTIHVTAIQPGS